jgi:beta-lactam-binding protein with PASTA domain
MRTRGLLLIPAVLLLALTGCSSAAPSHPSAKLVSVPDVGNDPISAASDELDKAGLTADFRTAAGVDDSNGYDTVATQTPVAGTKVKPGSVVHVVTSPAPLVTVPDVRGDSLSDAQAALSGVTLTDVDIPDSIESTMVVVQQKPGAGGKAQQGTAVTLTFKNPLEGVPNFVTLHYDSVTTLFGKTTFSEVDHPSDPDQTWHVTKQSPARGHKIPAGSNVDVWWGPPQVVYTITGNGSYASSITYSTGGTNQRQATNVRLPWSFTMPEDDSGFGFYIVLAQDGNGTSISCSITDDGTVLTRQTSTGRYAIAQCGN